MESILGDHFVKFSMSNRQESTPLRPLLLTWINLNHSMDKCKYKPSKVRDEINPFPNVNGYTVMKFGNG